MLVVTIRNGIVCCYYLVFDLVFLGILERNVVFGKTGLALSVLQENESDLRTGKG